MQNQRPYSGPSAGQYGYRRGHPPSQSHLPLQLPGPTYDEQAESSSRLHSSLEPLNLDDYLESPPFSQSPPTLWRTRAIPSPGVPSRSETYQNDSSLSPSAFQGGPPDRELNLTSEARTPTMGVTDAENDHDLGPLEDIVEYVICCNCRKVVQKTMRMLMARPFGAPIDQLTCEACLCGKASRYSRPPALDLGMRPSRPEEAPTSAEHWDPTLPRFEDMSLFDDSDSSGWSSPEVTITARRRAKAPIASGSFLPHLSIPPTKRTRGSMATLFDAPESAHDDSGFANLSMSSTSQFPSFSSTYSV
ncbi:hypothetical protein P389DRAFT_198194 [Cystobasidium minutum MCA 4210]|uniref:uncharacterized protein n=1 Tax=Cystobasidium minutum MCA 4210 TaxID=1397322 RepID=UPI0034CEE184|eukprot:jgi/Rhomi1/198194/gm1.6408_g